MARYEGELEALREAYLDEVFLKGMFAAPSQRTRQDAITCYLSGGEGWQEAIGLLGGAFAPKREQAESELTFGKAG